MKYYLGLDNGGTTTKAAVFTQEGTEVGGFAASTAMLTPKPDFVERDMEEMWRTNCAVIRGALIKSGVNGDQIAGLGICGHGKGLYLWGKDGKPARHGIISTDNRAYAYPEQWRLDGTEQKAFQLSCQHVMACQPAALLAWLRDNEPETFENIQWVFACKDYVRFRMTGEARAELTDYSGSNLLNLHTRNYDEELLKLFGIERIREALPPLCQSTEICGHITSEAAEQCGLPEGTPVIGGMFDIDACALAVGLTDTAHLCMIAGTWSINEYIRKTPVTDGSVKMNSLYCLPEYYLIEESSPTSAGNNEWFVQQMLPELTATAKAHGHRIYEELDGWVESMEPSEFVPVFLPFLMASNAHPNAKGAFVGVNAKHTRKHLLRSIYEGVAFCHKDHVERLRKSRSEPTACVRLAGGAAKSAVWTQMFADILQLPIETVRVNETGALGCAMAVAVAVGDCHDLQEAASRMCSIGPIVRPNLELKDIYEKKYALYKKTIECLDDLWDSMQKLIEENG